MGTLNEKLEYLSQTKEYIKEAIISKGQPVSSSDTFRSYASKIAAIENGDVITATNTTGSAVSADDKVWIEPQDTDPVTYNIIPSKLVTSTSFTAIAQANIANNASGSVKTILDGNGSYAPTLGTKIITRNNTYSASTEDLYGYSSVTVNVEDIPAVVESLSIIPTTSAQSFTPTSGVDGYAPVNVSAVDSTIDENIVAGNIKKDVTILGVTGTLEEGTAINNQNISVTTNGTYTADSGYTGLGEVTVNLPLDSKTITVNGTYNASNDKLEGYSSVTVNVADVPAVVKELNVTPTISSQTIRPEEGVDGFSVVNVSAVTSSIDGNILAGNIKSGVEILGVEGTYEGTVINNQNKSVIPSAIEQQITADSGYTGLGTVTVSGDSDLVSENIKSGVNIFGVVGNVVESNNTTTTITPTTSLQMITPDSPYNGFSSVTVDAVTNSIDENITAGNIKKDVTILGVTGTLEEGPQINNQNISVTTDGTYTAEQGYTGLGTVTVTAGAIASSETENQIAEQLMLINDGQKTFTLNVTPVDAEVLLVSTTNSVNITPTSSSDGTYVYDISMDSSKSYSYSVSKTGYVTSTGTINGGTASLTVTLVAES